VRGKRDHDRVLEGEMRSVRSADSWPRPDVLKGIEHQVCTSEPHCELVLARRLAKRNYTEREDEPDVMRAIWKRTDY